MCHTSHVFQQPHSFEAVWNEMLIFFHHQRLIRESPLPKDTPVVCFVVAGVVYFVVAGFILHGGHFKPSHGVPIHPFVFNV